LPKSTIMTTTMMPNQKSMRSELVFNRVEVVAAVANETPNDAPPDLQFGVA